MHECVITPHAQHERDKVIGVGVHLCMFVDKKIQSYFSNRFTLSNIRGKTSLD